MSYDSKAGKVSPEAKDSSVSALSDALGSFTEDWTNEVKKLGLMNPEARFDKIAKDTQELVDQKKLPELAVAAAATRGGDSANAEKALSRIEESVDSGAGTKNLDIQDFNPEPTKKNG